MPTEPDTKPVPPERTTGTTTEDQPIPRASDDEVLEDTARLAREGQREKERKGDE